MRLDPVFVMFAKCLLKKLNAGAAVAGAAAVLCAVVFCSTAFAAANRYTVRSESFSEKEQAIKAAQDISTRGLHPVIQTSRSASGEFFFLEMGSFENLDTATRLVMTLKDLGYDFFTIDNQSGGAQVSPQAAALVTPDKMAKIFPYQGAPQVDQWSLLEDILPTIAPPGGQQTDTTTGAQQPKVAFKRAKPRKIKGGFTNVPAPTDVGKKLRDMAWEMRGKGFGAYFEQETYVEPSGILVGMFDNEDDAKELANELKSYGYEVDTKSEDTMDGSRWSVYALVEELPPPQYVTPVDETGAQGSPDDGQQTSPGPDQQETPAEGTDLLKLRKPKKSILLPPPEGDTGSAP